MPSFSSSSLLLSSYENITLLSLNGDISVVLFLPYNSHVVVNIDTDSNNDSNDSKQYRYHTTNHNHRNRNNQNEKNYYYYGSRFDHGSMIGSITTKQKRKRRKTNTKKRRCRDDNDTTNEEYENYNDDYNEIHELFGIDMWRLPHNSHWPESGVGLASEYGVGDNGSTCTFRCGYPYAHDITNGILGYDNDSSTTDNDTNSEGNSNTFLKIGVGELYKGTCPECDSTNDYKFNSPYMFVTIPKWDIQIIQQPIRITTLLNEDDNNSNITNTFMVTTIVLDHEATLHKNNKHKQYYGYKIHKEIYIHPNNSSLIITTKLYNIGSNSDTDTDSSHTDTDTSSSSSSSFSTVWYSHNFFTCDHKPVGPGYDIDLNIHGNTILQQQQNQQQQNQNQNQQGGEDINAINNNNNNDPSSATTTSSISSSSMSSLLYDEPGTWSWSKPIQEYCSIESYTNTIHVSVKEPIQSGIRIKTEFKNDHENDHNQNENNQNNNENQNDNENRHGGYTITACDTKIESSLSWPEQYNAVKDDNDNNENQNQNQNQKQSPTIEMYAYNLYIERGTLSPEPQLLFSNIYPGSYVEWTQTLSIYNSNSDEDEEEDNEEEKCDDDIKETIINNNDIPILQQQQQSIEFIPSSSSLVPLGWLTNLLPSFKGKKSELSIYDTNNTNLSSSSSMISMILIMTTLVLLILMIVSPQRLVRQQQQQRLLNHHRRRQYETIV